MDVLTTPTERFADLPDWPWESSLADVGGLRMAYVDEGSFKAPPVLLLHGEPTWGYLYRHMIRPLLEAGHRVVVPDLIGFGRSDKPVSRDAHTYAAHVGWMTTLVADVLDLSEITLFAQDWGGLIGLRVVAADPARFARLVVANTGLPTGLQEMPEAFRRWQEFSQTTEDLPVGAIVDGGTARDLSPEEVAAYDAPFPDDTYKAGPRVMPALVPTSPEDPASADNLAAWEVLSTFTRPVMTAFSDGDPITAGGERVFHKMVPGTAGQPHATVPGGHFLQEDAGPELARLIDAFTREG